MVDCLPRVHWLTCSSSGANGLRATDDIFPLLLLLLLLLLLVLVLLFFCLSFHFIWHGTGLLPPLSDLFMQMSRQSDRLVSKWHVPIPENCETNNSIKLTQRNERTLSKEEMAPFSLPSNQGCTWCQLSSRLGSQRDRLWSRLDSRLDRMEIDSQLLNK